MDANSSQCLFRGNRCSQPSGYKLPGDEKCRGTPRKRNHIEPLSLAAAHRGEGAAPFSSLIWFAGIPPGSLEGGIADTRENGTLALNLQKFAFGPCSPKRLEGEAFQNLPGRTIRIWWSPVKSPSLIAGSEWPGKTAPFSSSGNSHAFE